MSNTYLAFSLDPERVQLGRGGLWVGYVFCGGFGSLSVTGRSRGERAIESGGRF